MSDTDDYRRRWQEAQEEARRRQDEHTRTMIVMLEKKVEKLFIRCQETWTQADEQKVVIGGLLATIDEMKATAAADKTKLTNDLKKRFKDVEAKIGEGRLGE